MKIAINTRLLKPGKLEGIGRFTLEILIRLIQRHPEHQFHLLFDHYNYSLIPKSNNVFCHTLFPPARRPWLFDWWFDFSVPRLLKKINADIFVSPDGHGSLRCPCPQLNVIHDLNFIHYPELLPKKYATYWNRHTRALVKKTTRIATVSEFSKQDIHQSFGIAQQDIDVLCNGTNPDWGPIDQAHQGKIRATFTDGQPYFIFIGSLHPRKNLSRILEAFHLFKKVHPEYHLMVVGAAMFNQDAPETLKHLTDVHWMGRRDGDELMTLLGASSGLVMVSLYEGFGIPIIEALQCDVPVLAANNSSMPEIGGEAILYANALNVEDIAHHMGILSHFDTHHQAWHKAKNEILTRYTWEKATDLFWHSIQQTLTEHAAK
ncbi:MAG: hypothetical protein RLY35_854 [Bacteroidota bacterium]|jgi:glycosyltransferase involved in cell wall biosynthesis